MSGYFDESYYLNAKLKQLSGSTDVNGNPWNMETLKAAIAKAGMTPEEHYNAYGRAEQLNPNAYFNETEYLTAKLASLRENPDTSPMWAHRTLDELRQVIADAGMNPAEHYEKYGAFEARADGTLLNPSNAFDANAYYAAKLAQLQANGESVDGKPAATMTVVDLVAAIKDAELSPITHYLAFGAAEAGAQQVAMVQTVPSEQRVSNDPARVVTGEFVPGNYNPPTLPPDRAIAAPVTKPADVGGKAPSEVSPAVTPPAQPLPVPGDANYVSPPAGLIDTNGKPVLPPSTSGTNAPSDNWVIVDPETGGGTLITPDGKPGGTLPPGTLDPSNPVLPPDIKPIPPSDGDSGGSSSGGDSGGSSTGGDSGGSSSGGDSGGSSDSGDSDDGDVPDTPLVLDISDKTGLQTLNMTNANDTLSGVKPEHLNLTDELTQSARLDGKGGIDTVNLTAGEYTIKAAQLASFENVNIANTTQDFSWRMGATDYAYADKVTIKAESLSGGNLRLNASGLGEHFYISPRPSIEFTVTTGDNADNVLWSPVNGKAGLLLNTGAGDDRVVIADLVGSLGKPVDAVFGDISDCNTSSYLTELTGTIELGAGDNTLVLHGEVDLLNTELKATGGNIVNTQIIGYSNGRTIMTTEQYAFLTSGGTITAGGESKNDDKGNEFNTSGWNNLSLFLPDGSLSGKVDLSKITIKEGTRLNLELEDGIDLTGDANYLGLNEHKATLTYRLKEGQGFSGREGVQENIAAGHGLAGITITGNAGDGDTLELNPHLKNSDGSLSQAQLVIGDGQSGGTVSGISELTLMNFSTGSLHEDMPTNVAFANDIGVSTVTTTGGDDTIDLTHLTNELTLFCFDGDDTVTGVTAAHVNDNSGSNGVGSFDGSEGTDSITFTAEAITLAENQLCNFENITFTSTDKDVSWTVGFGDYVGDENSVTVGASSLTTGTLTFDAGKLFHDTMGNRLVKFTVTGGAAADTFTGGSRGDTFTGGSGNDTFVYTNLLSSLLSEYDTITDFTTKVDKIKVTADQYGAIGGADGFVSVSVTTLDAENLGTAIGNALDANSMIANGAALVTNTADSKNYLILNDDTAVFNVETDAVIALGTHTIASSDFISA